MDALKDFEIRRMVMTMRKTDAGTTLNEYAGPLFHHRRFCKRLRIEHLNWAEERDCDIRSVGEAEAYKKAEHIERVMSTADIEVPDVIVNVIDGRTGDVKAAATGAADDACDHHVILVG